MKKVLSLIVVLLSFTLSGCFNGNKEIDLDKYWGVSIEGMSESGNLNAYFDSDKLLKEMFEKAGYGKKNIEEIYQEGKEKDIEKLDAIYSISNSLKMDSSITTGIKNGDIINFTLTYDKLLAADNKFELKFTKNTYTVSGLEEPILLDFKDIFDKVEVKYYGISPFVEAQITNNNSDPMYKDISYQIEMGQDSTPGLKVGETFSLVANVTNIDALVKEGYKIPQSTFKKEYTVGNLDKYIENYEDITKDYWKSNIVKEFGDKIASDLYPGSNKWIENGADNSFYRFVEAAAMINKSTIKEAFFLVNKNLASKPKSLNQLVVIYETEVDSFEYKNVVKDRTIPKHKLYTAIYADNFILKENSTIEFGQFEISVSDTNVEIQTIKNDYITSKLADYNVQEIPTEYLQNIIVE